MFLVKNNIKQDKKQQNKTKKQQNKTKKRQIRQKKTFTNGRNITNKAKTRQKDKFFYTGIKKIISFLSFTCLVEIIFFYYVCLFFFVLLSYY